MAENPYSPSQVRQVAPPSAKSSIAVLGRELVKFLGAYLLGIVLCVALTPVEMTLGGDAPLWIAYPILAPVGYPLFYFYLDGAYLPFGGIGPSYWTYFIIGLLPIGIEGLTYLSQWRGARVWRACWLGFPMGFVGTLGVYYTAAASI